MRTSLPFFSLCLLGAGCFPPETKTTLVPESPFSAPQAAPAVQRTGYAPAATEVSARVDQLGRNILAANPQIGVRPLFRTVGSPHVEIFHRGTTEITVTEGLVRQCRTDGELAAALCVELGKMISEREALAGPWKAQGEQELPPQVAISGDSGADLTRMAELARFDKGPRRNLRTSTLPPDPNALGKGYLLKAGFPATDFDNVAPLLRSASTNATLEKQMVAPGPARPWTK
ncbi:MAG: hypothetical protein JNM56_05570 [Planctomycetia bacterium]|nr:hypothetical protein [Planctomycetia bacterium]